MLTWMLPDLHEVEEGIVSEEKVKESEFTTGDVLKLVVAEMVTGQELRVVPASKTFACLQSQLSLHVPIIKT